MAIEINGKQVRIVAGAGARGWFGEGYWYHKIYKALIPGFKKSIETMPFVAKTTTLSYRKGNLAFNSDNFEPSAKFPACIKIYPFQGMMLNAVGLSGPGFKTLWQSDRWQKLKQIFAISFMPVEEEETAILAETREFMGQLRWFLNDETPRPDFWVQINLSCPNTLHDPIRFASLTERILDTFWALRELYGLKLDLKINPYMPNAIIEHVWKNNLCDMITLSNTIKWGSYGINWYKLFWWRRTSPLEALGGGGLSGRPIFRLIIAKLESIRYQRINIPIKVSGGIMSKRDIRRAKKAGADAIEIATAISLRPWRLAGMIKEAERVF